MGSTVIAIITVKTGYPRPQGNTSNREPTGKEDGDCPGSQVGV